jgi:hypothetical protein
MLTRREISAGKFYVNEHKQAAREVVEVTDRKWIKFNAYSLKTGRLTRGPHQTCGRDEMIHWADREATPEECAMLEQDQANEIFISNENENVADQAVNETIKAQTLTEFRNHTPPG